MNNEKNLNRNFINQLFPKQMKLKIFILFLFIGLNTIAQSTFKKGYFINNEDVKKEGFFKTYGTNLPDLLSFKVKQNSLEVIQIKKTNIAALKINNLEFTKKNVSIELLDEKMFAKKENNTNVFNLSSETLLLKVLLKFKDFTLYSYRYKSNEYFFIESQGKLEFLKYKKVKKNSRKVDIRKYSTQIMERFNIIDSQNQKLLAKLKYKEIDLVSFFTKYAKQKKYTYKKYDPYLNRDFKDAFNIIPKLGYSFNSQSVKTIKDKLKTSFNENHIDFGLDIEFFFNTLLKKSSIIFSYTHYNEINNEGNFSFVASNDSEVFNSLKMNTINLKYRHYFRILKNQYLYVDAGFLVHSSNGKVESIYTPTNAHISDLEYNSDENNLAFSLGLGYNYNNMYLELSYIPKMTGSFDSFTSNATTDSWQFDRSLLKLTIGYSIF